MNRFLKVICLLASSSYWRRRLLGLPSWYGVGGDSGGAGCKIFRRTGIPAVRAITIAGLSIRLSTGNFPIFTGIGTTDLTVSDVMVGLDRCLAGKPAETGQWH